MRLFFDRLWYSLALYATKIAPALAHQHALKFTSRAPRRELINLSWVTTNQNNCVHPPGSLGRVCGRLVKCKHLYTQLGGPSHEVIYI